jgi:hypothetical protein
MRNVLIVLSAAALLVAAGVARAATAHIEPGMWESTVTSKIDGLPSFLGGGAHTSTHRNCVTRKDTEFKPPHNAKSHCTYHQYPLGPHKVRWTVSCVNGHTTSHGTGMATYSRTHSKGHMDLKVSGMPGGKMMTMHETFESRRLGSCN